MSQLIEVKVPDIGDFAEVTVIELMVKPGDTIKPEQSLITVESDKASMEIPCSHAGVVKELKVKLGDKVKQGSLVVAPGVFEMISAKMADVMGFDALYMTGYGTVASYLGLPDAGLASYTDMVGRVQQFASITTTPMTTT